MSCQTENKYCTSGMSAKALSRQGDWADCLLMSLCHVRMLECFQHALFLPPTPLLGIVLSRAGVVRPAHRPKRGRTHCLLMSLCHVRMLECFQHALFLPPTPLLGIVLSRAGVVRPAHRPKRGRTHCPPTFSCKDNRTFSLFVAWHVQDT